MVEIWVLRTGKALHSLFSSGSVFMVVFFLFGFFFFPLWLHSSKTEYSLPQVYWTKSIATKENDSHFCFHYTSQPHSFLLGSLWVCRKVKEAACPLKWTVRWVWPRVSPQRPFQSQRSSGFHFDSGTLIMMEKIQLNQGISPLPKADIQHRHLWRGQGSHNLHLDIRRQTKEFQQATWRPSSCNLF